MKLYLSSYRIGDVPEVLTELITQAGANKKIAVIPNALDFATNRIRVMQSLQKDFSDLRNCGLEPYELDLREYFVENSEKLLRKELEKYAGVYVRGGNTFVLRRAFAQSKFDVILQEYKKNKRSNFVYAGYSAGVCVLFDTLRGIELIDKPEEQPEGYVTPVIWEGLGFLPYKVAVHFRSDHPESQLVNGLVEYYVTNKILFKALRDGEVIVEEV